MESRCLDNHQREKQMCYVFNCGHDPKALTHTHVCHVHTQTHNYTKMCLCISLKPALLDDYGVDNDKVTKDDQRQHHTVAGWADWVTRGH